MRTKRLRGGRSVFQLEEIAHKEQKEGAQEQKETYLAHKHQRTRILQLLVLEKLAAAEGKEKEEATAAATRPSATEVGCSSSSSSRQQPRSRYQTMMSFLNKHVKRFFSTEFYKPIRIWRPRSEYGRKYGDRVIQGYKITEFSK
ncbi:unnamed protein product [Urochloa humidicola]